MSSCQSAWPVRARFLVIFTALATAALALGLTPGLRPTTAAAATCPCTIWSSTTTPGTLSESDTSAVELGVKFQADVNGFITGLRFYKSTANTGTHVGNLWSLTGTKLATATFTGESASGWQQVSFSSPVAVTANTTYVASYHTNVGHYSVNENYFTSTGVDNSPLHALRSGVSGANGVYAYGAGGFPSNSFAASNYWVDVVFNQTATDTTPPTVTSTSPASGATGVAVASTLTATFSEPVQPTTIVFGLKNSAGMTIAGATSYTASTNVATFTPGAALATSTTHTATVSGAKDLAGNTMSPVSWSFTTAAAPVNFNPGNPTGSAPVPTGMGLENVSQPDHVIGDGTSASCTSAAVVSAVSAGGVITFNCGSNPITITLTQTAKVRNSTQKLVIDGGGKVTLSGGSSKRILYVDTCDTSLGRVSGNCLYAPTGPQVTVQNITLADGNATNSTYVSPGDTNGGSNGGGAIFDLGGRLKVVKSVFVRNTCAANGPDLGGAAIRVLAQHSATPNDLDGSSAARNQDPAYIVQSTFGGASGQGGNCSNGGAISGLRTPLAVLNSLITYNNAIGCCSNPAWSGTPGGGSGGAIYTDGDTYNLNIAGTDIENNTAKAGGSAIFYVSNDKTGHLIIDSSISKNNTYVPNGQPNNPHFQNYPGIFYLGNGNPIFTNSTIQ